MTDEAVRRAALDPTRSFIVQAPAGSGKTELLIQRYLALLGTVREPEQVVAITFTRKAAAEMRTRVLRALAAAAAGEPPRRPHERRTLELASEVAARDAALGWSLRDQPLRMRIDTLDALNVWLARQLPLLAGGVADARIVEDAAEQYRLAARRTAAEVAAATPLGDALRALLRSFDHRLASLEALLADLLPKRDQWLELVAGPGGDALRATLEGALERLAAEQADALAARWPRALAAETLALLAHAAQHAADENLRAALAGWAGAEEMPGGAASLPGWRAAAEIFLTRDGEWRRAGYKPHGFGADHAAERKRFGELLTRLAGDAPLRDALAAVAAVPEPRYSEEQWGRLAALRLALTRLAAELRVVFAEQGCVDFIELALAAQQALGRTERPSELLLALDQRIQHILVDEFQDTSRSQLRLLELLTSGWQPGDGRTLFLVGDPMQSIYRFRDADLVRFLGAKHRGVGGVRCEPLALERNFRSARGVVEFVNGLFVSLFPPQDDPAAGAAGFYPCVAEREAPGAVTIHPLLTDDHGVELERVVAIVADEMARDPEQSLAILVQSRTHLAGLREHLRNRGWPAHAVEIDSLGDHQLAQDLAGLTRALLHPADRVAWLAVLRAPWCGLTWTDLEALVGDAPQEAVWALLHDPERLARLTPDGRRRLERVRGVLAQAFAARPGRSLARWVEGTWRALGGAELLAGRHDADVAAAVLALLARHERGGDLEDPARLDDWLAKAPQPALGSPGGGIEIMTIHRAKGLEFDTVVLFGLGREPRGDPPQALYWMERATPGGGEDLLVAPPAGPGERDRLADFVRRAERARDLAERARLLYVATTRARERLHLVCRASPRRPAPSPGSLLALLWPHVAERFAALAPAADAAPAPDVFEPVLQRFAAGAEPAAEAFVTPSEEAAAPEPEYEWVTPAAVDVGTVVHRWLHRIAADGLERWSVERAAAGEAAYRRELELLGVEPAEAPAAAARVVTALSRVLEDPRGRWVLAAHEDARSELDLTVRTEAGLVHLRLDRTFVADGVRWIVDFKTGSHEGGERAAFLEAERERYRAQMQRYADAMRQLDPRPVRVALYFPLLQEFLEWEA
ncbi:MAG TPA: UvrD-helicase domain-containing protein [Gammaproteobacteria bacterium]